MEILKLLIHDLERTVGVSPESEVTQVVVVTIWYVHAGVQEYEEELTLEQLVAMAGGSEDWQPPIDPDVKDDPILEVDMKVQH